MVGFPSQEAGRTKDDIADWVPINEFEWPEPGGLFEVTCKNHPTAEYLTKNPWSRSLHAVGMPTDEDMAGAPRSVTGECRCPFDHLVVDPKSQD